MIQFDNVTLTVGAFCLKEVSFSIDSGQYAVLMGPTGAGKTTLLEAICGLRQVTSGHILIDEQEVTHFTPAERNLGYVPQDVALFSSMTVRENLSYALSVRRASKKERQHRAEELADWLGITTLLDRRPTGLSGGESRLVALGRALAARPVALLFDEPLTGLDETYRTRMIDLLRQTHQTTGATVLHVTHQFHDAQQLAQQQLRLENGKITQGF